MKKIIAMMLVLAMLLSITACAAPTQSEENAPSAAPESPAAEETADASSADEVEPIRIGVLIPFTGGMAYQGELLKEGYDYWADYFNSRGGIKSLGGAKIELVYADHAGSAETGVTEFERLVNVEKIHMATGIYGAAVMAAVAPLCEKYEIPFVISQCAATNILQQGYKYVFNPTYDARTNAQGLVGLIDMIGEMYGDDVNDIAFLCENSEWGAQQMENFKYWFEAAGKNIVFNETFEVGTADFSSIITKIKLSGAKFIVPQISAFNDATLFIRQLDEYQCDAGVFACGGVMLVPEFLVAVGDSAEYIFSTECWSSGFLEKKGAEALEIHQGFIDQYGHPMGENQGTAWIAGVTMIAALEAAASYNPNEIRDAIAGLNIEKDDWYMNLVPYEGIRFDMVTEDNQTNKNIYAITPCSQVIDGQWKMVWPNEMLENNPIVWPIPTE